MAFWSAIALYFLESICRLNNCPMITIKVRRNIRRTMRLRDWLNTGIDGKKKFASKLQCKISLAPFYTKHYESFFTALPFVHPLYRYDDKSEIIHISKRCEVWVVGCLKKLFGKSMIAL